MRGRGHVFDDPAKVQEMLTLRFSRVSTVELAARYGVDHSTIIYHCKKNGLVVPRKKSEGMVTIAQAMPGLQPVEQTRVIVSMTGVRIQRVDERDGTPINRGKTYAEYMEEAQKRKSEGRMYRDITESRPI